MKKRSSATRSIKNKWPRIYTRRHRSGQTGFLVDLGIIDGKRVRHSFSDKQEAETFAEQQRVARKNEGVAAFSLPLDVRTEAAKCLAKLQPHSVSLTEATDYYLKHVVAFRQAPTVAEIVKRIIDDAHTAGRREKTINDLRHRLQQFSLTFGPRQLATIELPEIESWVNDPTLSARSRINYATKASQLYNYAIKRGWVDANLVDRISRPAPEDKEPGILTIGQAETLLTHAPAFGLLPYIALGLFAGLRPTETLRLEWSAIKFDERAIIVGAEVAKKRSRRVVEINETLAAWMKPHMKERGPVVDPTAFRNHFNELRKKAEIDPWPDNSLRHSFGSYHLAAFGDAIRTAGHMGHRDPSVLHNHYKALVTKAEAEKFWALRPCEEKAEVVSEKAAA